MNSSETKVAESGTSPFGRTSPHWGMCDAHHPRPRCGHQLSDYVRVRAPGQGPGGRSRRRRL